MKTLTYQGLPVVRPSREQARQTPCCSLCKAPVIWVRNEWLDWNEPKCSNPRCASHIRREVTILGEKIATANAQEELHRRDEQQALMFWRCLFVGLYPCFLSPWSLVFVLYLIYHSARFLGKVGVWTHTLWNAGEV